MSHLGDIIEYFDVNHQTRPAKLSELDRTRPEWHRPFHSNKLHRVQQSTMSQEDFIATRFLQEDIENINKEIAYAEEQVEKFETLLAVWKTTKDTFESKKDLKMTRLKELKKRPQVDERNGDGAQGI